MLIQREIEFKNVGVQTLDASEDGADSIGNDPTESANAVGALCSRAKMMLSASFADFTSTSCTGGCAWPHFA